MVIHATRFVTLFLLLAALLKAQIPFTALKGLGAAKGFAGATTMPSALGAPLDPNTAADGKAMMWMYAFPQNGQITGAQVFQPMENSFQASQLSNTDTTNLPIYVNAEPLPDELIDSDSAMAIISANAVYQNWMAMHQVEQVLLLAGRVNEEWAQLPMMLPPAGTPAWVFIASERADKQLICWCGADGNGSGCMSIDPNARFSAHDGLGSAQGAVSTTEHPCLVSGMGTDTNGLARAWMYVFPAGDSIVGAYTSIVSQGVYLSSNIPVEDTTSDLPLYFRANPFQSGWINSTTAMERIRQTEGYRNVVQQFQLDTIMLVGGRLRPDGAAVVGQPVGTAIWLFYAVARNENGHTARLGCWCNLEESSQPFATCFSQINSTPEATVNASLVLLPNPASDGVLVRTSDDRPIERVTLYDMHGRAHSVPLLSYGSNAWLDVQMLSTGSYVVVAESGGKLQRQLLHVVR